MVRSLVFVISLLVSRQLWAVPALQGQLLLTQAPLNLQTAGKKGVVAIFLSAKCPCSNSHLGELAELAKAYPEFSFVAVHSNRDEPVEISKPYFFKAQLPFPVVEDDSSRLADEFHAYKTPHAFIRNADGVIVFQGGVSDSHEFSRSKRKYLREALEDLQQGRSVRTAEARSLGCVISRGEKYVW